MESGGWEGSLQALLPRYLPMLQMGEPLPAEVGSVPEVMAFTDEETWV